MTTTARGLVIVEGLGCAQLSDQQGNVIEILWSDGLVIAAWLERYGKKEELKWQSGEKS